MTHRPRLLDLFCGAGGAAMGYHRAGFDVVGVDIAPQKHYPFIFVQGDALEYCAAHGHEFDVIHASPPCQVHSALATLHAKNGYFNKHADLVPQTRELLQSIGKPYVIENVEGAPLIDPVMLCGTMFGLGVRRHRLFECDPMVAFSPASCNHSRKVARPGRRPGRGELYCVTGHFPDVLGAGKAMGIDWMTQTGLAQAIPPAYTEYIGRQLLQHMEAQP